jgi:hypothetical protein
VEAGFFAAALFAGAFVAAGFFFAEVFAAGFVALEFFEAGFFASAAFPVDLAGAFFALPALPALLLFGAAVFFAGSFLRFALASSASCFSLIDSTMLFDAPLSEDFDFSPRFAESAAPAAICCFLDLAGISNS